MIVYNLKCSLSPEDCTAHIHNDFESEAPLLSTIRRWGAELHRGRDEIREGHSGSFMPKRFSPTVKLVLSHDI